ncbi:MAG: AGE family epimerase/isomerase [Reyranellaceae bacterium]
MTDTDLALLRERLLQWLHADALPTWWDVGADRTAGGFHEAIDHAGQPVLGERRARVQARQIFSYAVGGSLGWSGPWQSAVAHGLDYYLGRYRRDDGLFWNALASDGRPIEKAPHLYEQAFALLALATAAGATGNAKLEPVAVTLVERLLADRRCPSGGFTGFADDAVYQSDPHMHLLEAALAWDQVAPHARWRMLADEVAELGMRRFVVPSGQYLLEYFNDDWSPASGLAGRLVWPGHQFEWAGLLERWGRARGRDDARRMARRLYRTGADHGIDPARGVAVFELLDDMSVHDPKARLWSQTEWLKAALILAQTEEDAELRRGYRRDAVAAANALLRFFETPVRGLWRDKLTGDGTWVEEPAPGSSFYHVIDSLRVLAAHRADEPVSG